jgi:hypothetical protein
MSDLEDAVGWTIAAACALFVLAFFVGIGLAIAWQVRESSAKQDCRLSGRRVIKDANGDEWWCAPITPEKP